MLNLPRRDGIYFSVALTCTSSGLAMIGIVTVRVSLALLRCRCRGHAAVSPARSVPFLPAVLKPKGQESFLLQPCHGGQDRGTPIFPGRPGRGCCFPKVLASFPKSSGIVSLPVYSFSCYRPGEAPSWGGSVGWGWAASPTSHPASCPSLSLWGDAALPGNSS